MAIEDDDNFNEGKGSNHDEDVEGYLNGD